MTAGTEGNDNLTNDPNVDPETVNALGGDDTITVRSPSFASGSPSKTVNVNGGEGFDALIAGGTYRSWSYDPATGNGGFGIRNNSSNNYHVNFTSIERFEIGGAWFGAGDGSPGRIDTGAGDDVVGFTPFVNSGGISLAVWTHGGNDRVSLSGTWANAVAVTEAGDDIINFTGLTGGSVGGYGGIGDDLYIIDSGGRGQIIEFANEGTDTVLTQTFAYQLPANVENLVGTASETVAQQLSGNDLGNNIRGNDANNVIDGNGGNDVIRGFRGNDTISGGEGDDTLTGDRGLDGLRGGAGNDTVDYSREAGTMGVIVNLSATGVPPSGHESLGRGIDTNEAIDTFGDSDTLESIENARGSNQADWLYGSSGANRLEGMGGNDYLEGGAGNDILDGGTGADRMIGGQGDDAFYVDDAGDTTEENAGEGNDIVYSSSAAYTLGANIETLNGTSPNGQTLTGNGDNNVIRGGSGNDTIDGGAGADTMIGGPGDDIYYVDNAGDVVVENPNEGTDEIRTSLAAYSIETQPNVENLTGTGSQGQSLTGNEGANVITGGSGNDVLTGLGGNDTYVVNNAGDRVVETAGYSGGDDEVQTALASYSLLGTIGIEVLRGTSNSGQTLTGSDEAETIIGGEGNDTLIGMSGDDLLLGNGGDDIFIGLSGSDTVVGGKGNDIYAIDAGDTVVEQYDGGTDEVRTVGTIYTLDANVENLRGQNDGGHLFRGNAGPNGLIGAGGNDLILAQDGGGDVVYTVAGNDFAYFGREFDQYDYFDGGSGTDTLILQGNYSGGINFGEFVAGNIFSVEVIRLLSSSDTSYGGQGAAPNSYVLTMKDSNVQPGEGITIDASGLAVNESLSLNATAETSSVYTVRGGAGNDGIATGGAGDIITGGGGSDSINAGGGADRFVYLSVSDSTATAMDNLVTFSSGVDKIDLSAIDANAATAGTNDAFTYIGSGAFTGTAGELRFENVGGSAWQVQGDVNGDGVADLVIQLNTGIGEAPLQGDFVL